jgi:mono/diheme cytochrome c family protein/plastocyanin
MTDQPERDDAAQERLPAPRPASSPVPAERFSAPPSTRRNDLTPERAAKIVRQSANARWVGFLAVTVVALFVIGYYFYELGLPGGLSESRLTTQDQAQQVTSIERGYNIYQANCAQCHGVNGEGLVGPVLNRQDKLFAHLNPDYLDNILIAGGRYACGNPDSIMPVWSNEGNPPGPLNYKQVEDLINFIRAEKGEAYRVMHPELWEPEVDPATGEELTFEGWVDPAYQPEPGATPYPACWADEFAQPSASPGASGEPSQAPAATVLQISAQNIQFDTDTLSAPADEPFQIEFANNDPGVPHDVAIRDANGTQVFKGDTFPGVETRTYDVPALPAGTYTFICTVHPNMTGTLTVGG